MNLPSQALILPIFHNIISQFNFLNTNTIFFWKRLGIVVDGLKANIDIDVSLF
jgi:hypothetical protein